MAKKKTIAQDALNELQETGNVILTAETHEQVMESAAELIEEVGGNAFVCLAAFISEEEHYAKVKLKPINQEE